MLFRAAVLILALSSASSACSGDQSGSTPTGTGVPVRIEIEPSAANLLVGQDTTFRARVLDSDGGIVSGTAPVWWASDPTVLHLDGALGSALALTPGTVTVGARVNVPGGGTVEGQTGAVTVVPAPPLSLNRTSLAFSTVQGTGASFTDSLLVTSTGVSLPGLSAQVAYPGGQQTGWLTATLQSPATPSVLSFSVNPGGLPVGQHLASIVLTAPLASTPIVPVPVTLSVLAPAPTLVASDTLVEAVVVAGSPPPSLAPIVISNGGGGMLADISAGVDYLAGASGWLTPGVTPSADGATIDLGFGTGHLMPGRYTARVDVRSPTATNSPLSILVRMTVEAAPPEIRLGDSTAVFQVRAQGGNPARKTIPVGNGGGGELTGLSAEVTYTSGDSGGWLGVTLGERAPTELILQPAAFPLSAGDYTATVEVRSDVASNSPRSVQVSLSITEARTLSLVTRNGSGAVISDPPGIDLPTCNVSPRPSRCAGEAVTAEFPLGSLVTLTVVDSIGFARPSISGAGCSGRPVCVVRMDQDRTVEVTAMFLDYVICWTQRGGGTLTATNNAGFPSVQMPQHGTWSNQMPCADMSLDPVFHSGPNPFYPVNATMSAVATPDPGWRFVSWSGLCSGMSPACEMLHRTGGRVGASFEPVPAGSLSSADLWPRLSTGEIAIPASVGGPPQSTTRRINASPRLSIHPVQVGWFGRDVPSWVGVEVVPVGTEADVIVTVDPAGLPAGTYETTVPILSYRALEGEYLIPVRMTIQP